MTTKQPWLGRPALESIFILAPALLPVLIVIVFHNYFTTHEVTTGWWIILVLCIDVSHVYSTLFRLYWDRKTFITYKRLLIAIPLIAFVIGFIFHLFDTLLFWRVLAYIAVYHFIRQQYGFMRLYARKETAPKWARIVDSIAIYSATLYPILYWHLHATDKLAWFIKGDFVSFDIGNYEYITDGIYLLTLVVYVAKEMVRYQSERNVNIPKNLIVLGTYASWYTGIVAFQGDLIFTLLNVVAHGIPYMTLIWIHGERKNTSPFAFNFRGVLIFVVTLLMLAYIEEHFWDSMVWKDHVEIFPLLSTADPIGNKIVLSGLVAILVLPQITHYVLDGFIWRFSREPQSKLD